MELASIAMIVLTVSFIATISYGAYELIRE